MKRYGRWVKPKEAAWRGDRWTRALGCPIPPGAIVRIVKYLPRRRVVAEYNGERYYTMLWCVSRI